MNPASQVTPPVSASQPSPLGPAAAVEPSTRPPEPAGTNGVRPHLPENFRDRFCQASQCAPHEFADRVFLRTLHFHALAIAPLLWPWRRRLFAEDFALIEKVASAQWRGDVQWKIDRIRAQAGTRGPGRRFLRWRISTRRLGELMGLVMRNSELTLPVPEAVPDSNQTPMRG